MTPRNIILAAVSTLGLAGCAAAPIEPYAYVGRYPAASAEAGIEPTRLGPGAALAVLPAAAGPVLSVRQTDYANGVMQQIVLGGAPAAVPGENRLSLRAETPPDPTFQGARDDLLHVEAPNAAAIEAELAEAFPSLRMQVSRDFATAPQGPFGYASGSAGHVTCLYAWEYLAPAQPLTLIDGVAGRGTYPLSVRLRLCRNLPLATLLDVMRELSVGRPGLMQPQPVAAVAGDALDAAIGSAAEALPVIGVAAPARRLRPAGAAPVPRRLARRLAHRLRTASRKLREPDPGLVRTRALPEAAVLGASPIPLPGDVAGLAPAVQPSAAPSAKVETDAMPLPR